MKFCTILSVACKHVHDILAKTETFNVLRKQSFMLVGVGI